GTHSPNDRAGCQKRHIGDQHRLSAAVNSPVRLELSPAPTGDWEVEAGPPAGGGSRPQRRKDRLTSTGAPFGRLRSGAHKLDSSPMNTFTPVDPSTSQMLTASRARLWVSPARLSPFSQRI